MRARKKLIPEFKNKAEEFEFWSAKGAGADSTAFVDWSKAKRVELPNLSAEERTSAHETRLELDR